MLKTIDWTAAMAAKRRMLTPTRPLSPQEIAGRERPRLRYLGPGLWLRALREAAKNREAP